MKGIKRHTHADRQKVIEEMIPLIKRKFGKNLVAIASSASFARNEDSDYSDLELNAFVKRMPKGKPVGGMGKVRDGMLVELVWTTKETYLKRLRAVLPDWFLAGSDRLVPILNAPLVESVNDCRIRDLKAKCYRRAREHWYELQEGACKVLNAIESKNRSGLPIHFFMLFVHTLVILSFLNQTPYITSGRMLSQAKEFKLKPKGFDEILAMFEEWAGSLDLKTLRKKVIAAFNGFERLAEDLGFDLYDDNVDPGKPSKKHIWRA